MKDKIINIENHYEQSEETLQSLQKEYLEPTMSEEQLSRLKMKMEEAKCENRKERRKAHITRISAAAAALVIVFIKHWGLILNRLVLWYCVFHKKSGRN